MHARSTRSCRGAPRRPNQRRCGIHRRIEELFTSELRAVVRDNGVRDSKAMDDVKEEQHACSDLITEIGRASIHFVNLSMAISKCVYMVELPNLVPPRSAHLSLDTKHSGENTTLLDSVGHTPGENPKIHIFAIRITNERIKLTSF